MLLRAVFRGDAVPAARIQRACRCAETAAKEKLGVQPSLAIGPANDTYEREADRVADQVVAGLPVAAPRAVPVTRLQRQQQDDDEETAQLKRTAAGRAEAIGASAAAEAVASGGRSLGSAERAFFEPRFGRDLSHVRLHTDAGAARAAAGIGARAFTLHNHIAFAPGQYSTATTEGRRLMAHELTHTLQQGSRSTVRRAPPDMGLDEDRFGRPGDPFGRGSRQMEDPRGPGASTLTYAQSRELNRCIKVMGDTEVARAECANTVLGTPLPEFKQVAGISSPVPFRAQVSAAGAATHRIGPVTLTVLPDATSADPAMKDRAETRITFPPLASGTNLVDFVTKSGRITSFTFNQDLFNLTIQTTFGPGVSAASASGYGRGTTADDQATGSTSLGFHEGRHGLDFITFLQDNPYPAFTGKVGQTKDVFSARVTEFSNAVGAYIARMNRVSELATDCAGTTIDSFNAAKGTATTVCVHRPGD